jgi:cyclophilin family peptidyl-prolyl cis-trans isomerase
MHRVYSNVFLSISIDDKTVGKLEIELFANTPKTSQNFESLCTGEKGLGK